jgi:uncharacterized protein (TIGR04255 family)
MEAENTGEHLRLAEPESPPFKRNAIKAVVCEVRFPTYPPLRSRELPMQFATALRKAYPHQETGFAILTSGDQETAHTLLSKDRRWKVTLRPSRFALETMQYQSFEDFAARFDTLQKLLMPHLDTDFVLRVGLRYTNALPATREKFDGWLRPELLGVLTAKVLGKPKTLWSEFLGTTRSGGGFTLRWGFPDSSEDKLVLDTDLYVETLETTELLENLKVMHDESFGLFKWCIDEAAIAYLNGSS